MFGRYGRTTATRVFAGIIGAELSSRLDGATGYNPPPGTDQPIVLKHPDIGRRGGEDPMTGYRLTEAQSLKQHTPPHSRQTTPHPTTSNSQSKAPHDPRRSGD